MAVKTGALQEIATLVKDHLSHADIVIDSVAHRLEISSVEQTGAQIVVKVYADDSYVGTVTNTRLYTVLDTIFDERPDNIVKPAGKGITIVFTYNITQG